MRRRLALFAARTACWLVRPQIRLANRVSRWADGLGLEAARERQALADWQTVKNTPSPPWWDDSWKPSMELEPALMEGKTNWTVGEFARGMPNEDAALLDEARRLWREMHP